MNEAERGSNLAPEYSARYSKTLSAGRVKRFGLTDAKSLRALTATKMLYNSIEIVTVPGNLLFSITANGVMPSFELICCQVQVRRTELS